MTHQFDRLTFLEVAVLKQHPKPEWHLRPVRGPLWALLEPADQSAPQLESFGREWRRCFTGEPGQFLGGSGDLAAHLLKGVLVEIGGERDRRMTEDFADHLEVHPSGPRQTGEAVPQFVNRQAANVCFGNDEIVCLGEGARVQRIPTLRREHQAMFDPIAFGVRTLKLLLFVPPKQGLRRVG